MHNYKKQFYQCPVYSDLTTSDSLRPFYAIGMIVFLVFQTTDSYKFACLMEQQKFLIYASDTVKLFLHKKNMKTEVQLFVVRACCQFAGRQTSRGKTHSSSEIFISIAYRKYQADVRDTKRCCPSDVRGQNARRDWVGRRYIVIGITSLYQERHGRSPSTLRLFNKPLSDITSYHVTVTILLPPPPRQTTVPRMEWLSEIMTGVN